MKYCNPIVTQYIYHAATSGSINTVQTLNMVIWYKLRLDISYKKLWSQIFSGFYNVKDKKLDIRSTWYKRQHLTVPSRPLYRVYTVLCYYTTAVYSILYYYSIPYILYYYGKLYCIWGTPIYTVVSEVITLLDLPMGALV